MNTIVYRVIATGIVLAVLAGLIGAAEWFVRYRGDYQTWLERNGGEYMSPYRSQQSWFLLRPAKIDAIYNRPEFDYELSTNAEGLRDREHPVGKDAEEFRVMTIGDSFTEGQGARVDETWPRQLEDMLNVASPTQHVRVINAGVAGSDPIYGYKLLEQRLLKYQPDLVIVAVNSSDIDNIVSRGGMERFAADGTVAPARQPKIEWLFARSHLFRLVAMDILGYDWLLLRPRERRALNRKATEQLADVAVRFQRLGEAHEFDVLVVMHPKIYELKNDKTEYAELPPKLESASVKYVDLADYFKNNIPEARFEEIYWPIDRHHNAAGYRLFAQGVAEALSDAQTMK